MRGEGVWNLSSGALHHLEAEEETEFEEERFQGGSAYGGPVLLIGVIENGLKMISNCTKQNPYEIECFFIYSV